MYLGAGMYQGIFCESFLSRCYLKHVRRMPEVDFHTHVYIIVSYNELLFQLNRYVLRLFIYFSICACDPQACVHFVVVLMHRTYRYM